tara:strand:+ start:33 stop:317 length:285 start_codon:yes stop_codon:yes gene_type:complete
MTNVVYNVSASGPFFLSYEAMRRFNNLGYKFPEDVPRHHPLLIHLYEKDKKALQGIGCRLNMKEIKGCIYTIISEYGKEEVKEPEEIKWIIVRS